jgi:hypothetical protein
MKVSSAAALSCAVVFSATLVLDAAAAGRGGGGRSGGHSSGHRGHHHAHTRVFVGGSFFFGPSFYPAPYYYPVPVYAGPPPAPPVYVEQGQDPANTLWYYCQSAGAYYPYVGECPEGWQQVVPDSDPQPDLNQQTPG